MTDYRNELDQLALTERQQEQLVGRLLSHGEHASQSGRRMPPRALVALVAAVSLLIGAAGAVSLAGLSPEFRAFFGITDEAQEKNVGALAVDQVFKDKNGSGAYITVREVVADQERLYILMDFTAPEGTVLPTPERGPGLNDFGYWLYGTDENWIDISLYSDSACTQSANPDLGSGFRMEALPDGDPTDNVITLLFTMSTDRGLPEAARYFSIRNILCLYTTQNGDLETVVGNLDIEVTAPIPSDIETYSFGGRSPVKLGGTTMAVVENLTISPISLTMDVIIPDSDAYDAAMAEQGPWPVYVLLNDGTRVAAQFPEKVYGRLDRFYTQDGEVSETGGMFFRADHVTLTLAQPIDLSQMEDIVFEGDNDPITPQNNRTGEIDHFMFSPGNFYNDVYWDTVNENWAKTAD